MKMKEPMEDLIEQEKKTILIVDDEESIVDLLEFNLQKEGYKVLKAYDGIAAVDIAISQKPDLMLLDIMIPRLDGISVCKKIRYYSELSAMPILMVSAKDTESDKIVGLEMGADDYITKPFQIRELMARIKANLRKSDVKTSVPINPEIREDDDTVRVGDLILNLKKLEVKIRGKMVNLTKKEFEVLKYLALQPGEVVTREKLLQEIWEYTDFVGAIRTIDVTINRIRDKIEIDKSDPKILVTKRGIGYYIVDASKK